MVHTHFARTANKYMRSTGIFFGLFAMVIFSSGMPLRTAYAAVQSPTATGKVSFTFDDGLTSTYTNAAPIMQKYGLPATTYIPTSCIGSSGTCPENPGAQYMTWTQVQALQNTYGWEVGSHTANTPCLASSAQTDPADCPNAAPLTTAQIDAELANSQSTLASYGIKATDFAPPFGDFNNNVMAQVAKYYATMRQFQNTSNNTNSWPYSEYFMQDYPVLETTTPVSAVETAINNAITNKQWLILTFHDIMPTPSSNPDSYQYGTAELTQLAAYVQAKVKAGQLQNVMINQGAVTSTTNLLPDVSFNNGIADGWTTDSPATITADSGSNGSYPDPAKSIKLTSGTTTGHLFSPKVAVTPGTQYMVKSFLNLQSITAGSGNQVGYYIDEYDANGNWVSGQWKTQETGAFVENMNYAYTPSSTKVASASMQVIVAPNANITAYIDNFQMFPLTATVAPTNLVANGTFDSGIAAGWSTDDPSNITADAKSNGSPANPVNSISLKSGTRSNNGHLFSPMVAVDPTKSYSITSWLNLKQMTNTTSGEVGYYIDEYNASGAWISGQYKTGVHTLGISNVGFTYTPSSSSVAKASLQVIVVSNAGIQAYFDNVSWVQQ